jgi:hypothetical protein
MDLLVTEDESWMRLAIVDDKTLAVRDGGEFNLNNVPLTTKSGDEIDAFHGYWLLLKGAPELPLAHGDEGSGWSIADYKSDDGPARLPKLELPKPVAPRPPPPDFVEAAAANYLAGKIAQHAGGKLPSLTGGTRGAHAYEVPPADAAAIAKALGSAFSSSSASDRVFVAILETGDKPQLRGLAFSRADIGKAQIGITSFDATALDGATIAKLLVNAKELPVPGRIEGFSPSELAPRPTTVAQVIGAEKPALPPVTTTTTDRSRSPLATRLQAMTPTVPTVKLSERDGEVAARAFKNLITEWGDAKDAESVAKLLAGAAGAPAIYAAFAAEVGGKKGYWHPGHVKAAFAERESLKPFAGPIAATLAAVPDAPPGLDPAQLGKDLKNLVTGWYGKDELERLAAQLPAILDDAFAFAALALTADGVAGVDNGVDAARAQVKKVATRELKDRSDPAEQALLQQLATL